MVTLLCLLFTLTACSTGIQTVASTELETQATVGAPTLLASYYTLDVRSGKDQRNYTEILYRPRQFQSAPYVGWDVLSLPGGATRLYTRPDWLNIKLNRSATLVVIWNGSTPGSWLSSWTEGPRVDGKRSFSKVFQAGNVVLGSIEGTVNQPYLVLFGEANGRASVAPTVPAGLQAPLPNQPCPAWVHDAYMTKGLDGKMYRTWHPQIDPVYWCYFGHEHGSDPSLFTGKLQPLFNYYADKGGPNEAHEGFKVHVLNTTTHSLMFTLHTGTSDEGRICARTHALDIAVALKATGEVLADLHAKPDFGYTLVHDTGAVAYRLSHPNCRSHDTLTRATTGGTVRIPAAGTSGYEAWNVDYRKTILGVSNAPAFLQDNPAGRIKIARDASGKPIVNSAGFVEYGGMAYDGKTGERRWFIIPNYASGGGLRINAAAAAAQGVFYTDYLGQKLLSSTDPKAVRQYIKPGLNFFYATPVTFATQDAWRNEFLPSEGTFLRPPLNLEGGLKLPN